MSFYEKFIYDKLQELHRYNGGAAVRTTILADLLGKHDRTIRYKLVELEQRGVVQRVGNRGGWLPARMAVA
jgi:predicted transcriptional regulator